MAHLDDLMTDSEFGFLEYMVRWIDKRAIIQFSKYGDKEYKCWMIYHGTTHDTTGTTPFDALKKAAGKHSSDTLYGAEK